MSKQKGILFSHEKSSRELNDKYIIYQLSKDILQRSLGREMQYQINSL